MDEIKWRLSEIIHLFENAAKFHNFPGGENACVNGRRLGDVANPRINDGAVARILGIKQDFERGVGPGPGDWVVFQRRAQGLGKCCGGLFVDKIGGANLLVANDEFDNFLGPTASGHPKQFVIALKFG